MKKSSNPATEDMELQQFFGELKTREADLAVPDLDELLGKEPVRKAIPKLWRFAAVVALLIIGFSSYKWGFSSDIAPAEITEIIISYETVPIEEETDDLQMPGMDQWQSETDILLTGL